MAKKGELVGVDRIIDGLKRDYNLSAKEREYEALRQWGDIVEKRIADNAKPLYIADGALYVSAKGSVWCQEISFLKSEIIKKINDSLGFKAVKEIRYKVEE